MSPIMFYEIGDYYNYSYDDDVGKLWHRKSNLKKIK